MNEDIEAIRVCGFWYWLWCRTGGYRAFSRWVHRHNWHHCTVMGPFTDGSMQHWCQWCGLRYCTPPPELTAASSAAFSLADQLTEFFKEHPDECDPLCTCGHWLSDHPHDHACMRSECPCHAFVDQRG